MSTGSKVDKGFNHYDWIDDTKYPEKLFHQVREWETMKAVDYHPYQSVLDAGCGTGLITRHLHDAIGIDINAWAIERAKIHAPKAKYLVASIDDLPFDDKSFDLVICTHTLEHLDTPKKALDEFMRVLKPNGTLIGAVPSDNILWSFRRFLTHSDISEEPIHVNYSYRMIEKLLIYYTTNIRESCFGMEWQFVAKKGNS